MAVGYRSRRRQEDILESAIQERMAQGLPREQARAKALETIAQPGHSEHETGLALDFNDVSQGFQETEAYQWLRQHGAAYGFIQRYQSGKEDVTGVKAEPWHFRYVGAPHAQLMETNGLCLEEYRDFLRQGPRSSTSAGKGPWAAPKKTRRCLAKPPQDAL